MTRPIARPANVSARTRRRQGSSLLFRVALALAFVVTCVLATPVVLPAVRSARVPGGAPPATGGTGLVSGQTAMAGLASGACVSFTPSSGRYSKTVFIDPGHGGPDPGVVGMAGGRRVLEKTVALSVGTRLAELLRGDGYRVVMSRTTDSSVASLSAADSVTGAMTASAVHRDLVSRTQCANAASASVLVSIHFDAFDDPSIGGAETFYDAARPFAASNRQLATDLQAAMVEDLGVTDRGIFTDDQLGAPTLTTSGSLYNHLIVLGPAAAGWVDNPSQMPGALVEPLFITNPAEAQLASEPAGQQRVAVSLQRGVNKFLSGA
jgi:N-acetylmuramoyl-L-alanine amidase